MLKIKSTKVSNRAQYIFSIFVLVFIFTFVFLISFYRIPLGDDVLTQFMNGGAQYIDGYRGGIGNQISDFYSLYQSVRWFYLNWGFKLVCFSALGVSCGLVHKASKSHTKVIQCPEARNHCLADSTGLCRLRRVGVPREGAMRLVNHSSELIYQIYQRERVEVVAQWRDTVKFPA